MTNVWILFESRQARTGSKKTTATFGCECLPEHRFVVLTTIRSMGSRFRVDLRDAGGESSASQRLPQNLFG